MSAPFCVLFAWTVGSGKTPIAIYLSQNLGLPIFSNDAIRSEVVADFWELNEGEYIKRRDIRLQKLLTSEQSFILDASVDRVWGSFGNILKKHEFATYIISLDLSLERLQKWYESKKYDSNLQSFENFTKDHENFLSQYGKDVNIHITDAEFLQRMELILSTILEWRKSI